ncbi:MAG: Hpt domain-containing protein [Deltaproteobacteria bacterium]|nr:Hpt domain-containing protein [Deltaproteobacteria bacterium]
MQIFNMADALSRAGDDKEFLLQLINYLQNTYLVYINRAAESIEADNLSSASKEIHSLKGALLNLGAEKAGHCAKEIEAALKANENKIDLDQLKALVEEFLHYANQQLNS